MNLVIKVGNNTLKKIDVYDKDNKFIASIGSSLHMDYPSYILAYNLDYANKRQALYILRHSSLNFSKEWLSLHLPW